ncbi:MAG: hypothetical protein R2695_05155 [Acidimicrobiales bacterium]
MKVVLFCGGQGMRMREYSDRIPKPMVPIGVRPILWHLMRYYAHYGHTEFVLCLGYQADKIKYFLSYREEMSNDFVLTEGGGVQLLNRDIESWRISFVDTGLHANVGTPLIRAAVRGERGVLPRQLRRRVVGRSGRRPHREVQGFGQGVRSCASGPRSRSTSSTSPTTGRCSTSRRPAGPASWSTVDSS